MRNVEWVAQEHDEPWKNFLFVHSNFHTCHFFKNIHKKWEESKEIEEKKDEKHRMKEDEARKEKQTF